jgi:hypothetical protein
MREKMKNTIRGIATLLLLFFYQSNVYAENPTKIVKNNIAQNKSLKNKAAPKNQILTSSNMSDRITVLINNHLWERRWNDSTQQWLWISHSQSSFFSNSSDLILGPLLCNTSLGKCRQFIGAKNSVSLDGFIQKMRWYLYDFNINDTDYLSLSSANIIGKNIQCSTNLEFDSIWGLYCLHDTGYGDDLSLRKYDIYLNILGSNMIGKNRENSKHEVYMKGELPKTNLCIMPNRGIFLPGYNVKYFNRNLSSTGYSDKYIIDVSDGFTDKCFAIGTDYKLYEYYFNGNKNKWQRVNHGRPIKKKYIKSHFTGSMRKLSEDKLLYLFETKDWQNRIYERYFDGSRWRWADHGYSSFGKTEKIGWGRSDRYFILTDTGNLVMRHFSNNQWGWVNHGTP